MRTEGGLSYMCDKIYKYIKICCKEDGYCYVTNEVLAQIYKVSIRTVQRKLGDLKEEGKITIIFEDNNFRKMALINNEETEGCNVNINSENR